MKFSFLFFSFHFEIETEQEIFEEVLRGDLDFSSDPWPNVSESAKDLVRKMLVRDPRKRITAHEVLCKLFISFSFSFSFFFPSVDIYENNHE
jgi:serine/threonine protein kinase